MPKRPKKPEGEPSKPRFKDRKTKTLSESIELSRRLIDLDYSFVKKGDENYQDIADDRSFAILRGANIEKALEGALIDTINIHEGEKRNLLRNNGPLATFVNKITMAYALNILGPVTKKNLDIIRHIRNVFAHARVAVNFDTKEIIDLTEFLVLPRKTSFADINEIQPNNKYSPFRYKFDLVSIVIETNLLRYSNKKLRANLELLGKTVDSKIKEDLGFDETLP